MKPGHFILPFLLLIVASLFSQDSDDKWQRMGGRWEVKGSKAVEANGFTAPWNFYLILDYNTILSLNELKDYDSIEFSSEIFGRKKSPVEMILSFAVRSEYKSWYYHMYGVRFTGGFWGINKLELIHSDMQDRTKPYTVKENRFVRVLASAECSIKYDRQYNYRLTFTDGDITLYINNEKILSARNPVQDISGRIGFSCGNARLSLDRVRVLRRNAVIFEDDFDTDSIYVRRLKATVKQKENDEGNKN